MSAPHQPNLQRLRRAHRKSPIADDMNLLRNQYANANPYKLNRWSNSVSVFSFRFYFNFFLHGKVWMNEKNEKKPRERIRLCFQFRVRCLDRKTVFFSSFDSSAIFIFTCRGRTNWISGCNDFGVFELYSNCKLFLQRIQSENSHVIHH